MGDAEPTPEPAPVAAPPVARQASMFAFFSRPPRPGRPRGAAPKRGPRPCTQGVEEEGETVDEVGAAAAAAPTGPPGVLPQTQTQAPRGDAFRTVVGTASTMQVVEEALD